MKYLVTGGHGKLGKEVCPLIDCITPIHDEMDILDIDKIERYISNKGIDAILHLAAITNRKMAGENKFLSYATNVIGTRNVAASAAKFGKKIIYISTEIVFDCSHGDYKEDDPANPRDWYAFTKYAGEIEIQNTAKNYLIIRTTFRPSNWGFSTAYTNVYTTGDYVDVIAKEIALALNYNLTGLIHIGTPKKTLYELASRRNPEVQPEEFPDPTFLHRDLNIEKWGRIKKNRNK